MDSLGTDFDTLLTHGALAALLLAGAWALVVVVAVALEAHTCGRLRFAERAGCPTPVRMWLLGVFVVVFAGVAPAYAGDSGTAPGAGPGAALGDTLDGLPLPDRTGVPSRSQRHLVVVEPGDSLWRVARTLLPAGAPDPAVAAAAAELYAANRRTVGPDPDLLRPGQRLLVGDPDTISEAP